MHTYSEGFSLLGLLLSSNQSGNTSLFGMSPYGYNSGYNLPGMPLYNNMASYYMPLSGISSFGLPFYGMSPLTFYGISPLNTFIMSLFNTLNPGLGGIYYGLGGGL
jgi:hypothetical protein